MPPRPRRAAAAKANTLTAAQTADPDADPDFLALSAKQRRAVDKAFDRGLRAAGIGGRKRRKLNAGDASTSGGRANDAGAEQGGFVNDEDMGGGFVDDHAGGGFMDDAGGGGGFMDDDEGAGGGGFLPDDEDDGGGGFMLDDDVREGDQDGDEAMDGGFLPDREDEAPIRTPKRSAPNRAGRIPLHVLPGLLGSLGLPTDDDVLAVFRASATGWDDDGDDTGGDGNAKVAARRRGVEDGDDAGAGVGLKDFRAVCAALMGPEEDDATAGDDVQSISSDDASDTFQLDDDESLSDLSSDSEFGDAGGKGKGKGKARARGTESAAARRGRRNKKLEEEERVKLSSRQKDMVAAIWGMIKPGVKKGGAGQRGGMVLGRDELKVVVRDFGEMWTDEEITEMITLFSSQHEGRGLTYDDFGAVMLRAGLV